MRAAWEVLQVAALLFGAFALTFGLALWWVGPEVDWDIDDRDPEQVDQDKGDT